MSKSIWDSTFLTSFFSISPGNIKSSVGWWNASPPCYIYFNLHRFASIVSKFPLGSSFLDPSPNLFFFSGNVKIIGSLFCGVSFSLVPYFPRDFLPRTGPKLLLSFPHFVRQEGKEREGPRGWEGASFPFHRQTTRWPAIMVKIYLKARREIPLSSPASWWKWWRIWSRLCKRL